MTELIRRAGELDWKLERGTGTSGMGGALSFRRKDGGTWNMRWESISCQQEEQEVDSKMIWQSCVHGIERVLF